MVSKVRPELRKTAKDGKTPEQQREPLTTRRPGGTSGESERGKPT